MRPKPHSGGGAGVPGYLPTALAGMTAIIEMAVAVPWPKAGLVQVRDSGRTASPHLPWLHLDGHCTPGWGA